MTTHEHVLDGCRPVPLAHYLKALGVLRLVAEQRDPGARGAWSRDRFVLHTELGRDEVQQYFLEQYAPTPIVAPWNGGSGFYPNDNRTAIEAIHASTTARLGSLRGTIESAAGIVKQCGTDTKPSGEAKAELLQICRSRLPDAALDWLDAALLLTDEGPKFPPLLGTGGNDGRLDFTNNFMQRLLDVVDPGTGAPTPSSASLLAASLFDEPCEALQKAAIGQFLPSGAGGANASVGFEGDAVINPWDFVLMIEGSVTFASAAVRKMEHDVAGAMSFPFTVRQVGVGYASASDEDEAGARAEMWMPLWSAPATHSEVRHLLAEGRVRIGGRSPRNGVDFARAVATLGVDRGIVEFQRFGFQVRNGRSYLAVPLNRYTVRAAARTALLQEIDGWLDDFRRRAGAKTAPASAHRALRQLEGAILELCQHGDAQRLQRVLIELGRAEGVMVGSASWAQEARLQPVPPLSPEWLHQSNDGSAELRLAASLASVWGRYADSEGRAIPVPLRRQLEPVTTWVADGRMHVRWDPNAGRDVVWTPTHLEAALNAVLRRRLTRAIQGGIEEGYADTGRCLASLGDIADFIEGRIDESRLADLLWGCVLLDWWRMDRLTLSGPQRPRPAAFYALLKLCFPGQPVAPPAVSADGNVASTTGVTIPLVPEVHRLAAAGRGAEATRQAVRRLRGSGLGPAVRSMDVRGDSARRSAAALLFPIGRRDLAQLATIVLRPEHVDDDASSSQFEHEEITT